MGKVRFLGVLTMIALVFGVVFLMDLPTFLKYKKGEVKSFDELMPNELNVGDLVSGTIDFTDGSFAEMEETNTTFGIETSRRTTKQYYAVYMYNDMYVAYETGNAEQIEKLDQLTDECRKYYESIEEAYAKDEDSPDFSGIFQPETVVEFSGKVEQLPADLDGLFREWYGEGYDKEVEKVLITYSDFSRFSWIVYAGIGCAALGIILLIVTIIVWRKEKGEQSYSY